MTTRSRSRAARPGDRRAEPGRDTGLASIELAILLPVFALLAVAATVLGRGTIAKSSVDFAAHDAARTASMARTSVDAQRNGKAAGAAAITASGTTCTSVTVTIDTTQWLTVPVGQPATVTATVTCQVDLRYLAFPGIPGQIYLTSKFTSPIDQYRSRS